MTEKGPKILIASGKTGGHLFPGIACAQAVKRADETAQVFFAGTGTDFEVTTLEKFGFSHTRVRSMPVKGRNPIALVFSLIMIPLSVCMALPLIVRLRPDVVMGTGAYSAFPVVAAARILGVKSCIHEQNTIPGLTNRVLSRIVNAVFISFANTRELSNLKKTVFTGNPVRRPAESAEAGDEAAVAGKDNRESFTIMVSGGSQGARSINTAFVSALKLLENPQAYTVIHQTGRPDEAVIQEAYKELNLKSAIVRAFFDNPGRYQEMADIIISRAGAGTISEITLKSLPAILVPYPYAADDHQTSNAKAIADGGAAVVIPDRELSGPLLKTYIESFKSNRDKLSQMAKNAKSLAIPDADERIARQLLQMAAKGN